jgi:ABC-type transport system involved in cytochrome c biogenesis permease subunit
MMEMTQNYTPYQGFFKRLGVLDWLYAVALCMASLFALNRFGAYMDVYEKGILLLAAPTFAWLGWHWKPVRPLIVLLALLSFAIHLYAGSLEMANQKFFLKYLLSSQSAILWMSTLFFLSTLFYWGGLIARSDFGASVGSVLCWAAVVMGFTGMLVRWYESYLVGTDIGHIPVSNLYEVFILFSLITALFICITNRNTNPAIRGICVARDFCCGWIFAVVHSHSRCAEIQPLVPALQSWWMKIHVPANFIGYGTFALAAMVAMAYLLKSKGYLEDRLPALEVDDVMYKAIAVGFAFFTIATILGALGGGSLGRLLVMGPERNLGADRLAELRCMAAHAPDEGLAGAGCRLVGAGGFAGDDICFPLASICSCPGLHSYGTL